MFTLQSLSKGIIKGISQLAAQIQSLRSIWLPNFLQGSLYKSDLPIRIYYGTLPENGIEYHLRYKIFNLAQSHCFRGR